MADAEGRDTHAGPVDVAVVGLGYAGLTLASLLADGGATVLGVERDRARRDAVANARPLMVEPGVDEALRRLPPGRLRVAERLDGAVAAPVVVICVGTPFDRASGRPDLSALEAAADDVARAMTDTTLVVIRSTVPVGTSRSVVLPRLRRTVDQPLLAFCPERTIQGQALRELRALPQVVGGLDPASSDAACGFFGKFVDDCVPVSSMEAAELVKLANNAHTDLIYGFGNEVAFAAEAFGLDADEVVEAANVRYPRPDLSRPGFVGGSCMTKDPYLLMHAARSAGYEPQLVAAARRVNESLPGAIADRVLEALHRTGRPPRTARVTVCGIAYKGRPETDDTRGSAAPVVAARLGAEVGTLAGQDFVVGADAIGALGFEPVTLEEGLVGADAAVFLSDHPAYAAADIGGLTRRMARPGIVFDLWGVLDGQLPADDVVYLRFGRG